MACVAARSRKAIRVRGVVQGVGFRPAVYRIARAAGLAGFVRNDSEGVWIEIEGEATSVEGFVSTLVREAPPLSEIEAVEVTTLPLRGDAVFRVQPSGEVDRKCAIVPVDCRTCAACVAELYDPGNRRNRCSIVRDVPYDRRFTSMATFVMCDACRTEYEDPADRRFHAEPNACPACGPRLVLHGPQAAISNDEAVQHRYAELIIGVPYEDLYGQANGRSRCSPRAASSPSRRLGDFSSRSMRPTRAPSPAYAHGRRDRTSLLR